MNALFAAVEANVPPLLADAALRTIVLTGTGKAFCAGVLSGDDGAGGPQGSCRARVCNRHTLDSCDCEKPVIAAVNGAAGGGGRAPALLADTIITSRDTYFVGGYSRLGALPDLGPLQTLPLGDWQPAGQGDDHAEPALWRRRGGGDRPLQSSSAACKARGRSSLP